MKRRSSLSAFQKKCLQTPSSRNTASKLWNELPTDDQTAKTDCHRDFGDTSSGQRFPGTAALRMQDQCAHCRPATEANRRNAGFPAATGHTEIASYSLLKLSRLPGGEYHRRQGRRGHCPSRRHGYAAASNGASNISF